MWFSYELVEDFSLASLFSYLFRYCNSKKFTIALPDFHWKSQPFTLNLRKLEADVSIAKTVNNLLMKKSVDIERQCWENAPNSCRECLEIAGIPTSVPQQSFEEKVCQIYEAIGVSVDKNDIDDCHWLRDKE